jgi:hypothetical protein
MGLTLVNGHWEYRSHLLMDLVFRAKIIHHNECYDCVARLLSSSFVLPTYRPSGTENHSILFSTQIGHWSIGIGCRIQVAGDLIQDWVSLEMEMVGQLPGSQLPVT